MIKYNNPKIYDNPPRGTVAYLALTDIKTHIMQTHKPGDPKPVLGIYTKEQRQLNRELRVTFLNQQKSK